MIFTYLKHIIAKKNYDITKNKFFRAKKRNFLTFFAIYSKRDFSLGWAISYRLAKRFRKNLLRWPGKTRLSEPTLGRNRVLSNWQKTLKNYVFWL